MIADRDEQSPSVEDEETPGAGITKLSVVQFFLGGFVLFVAALMVITETSQTEYDGGISAIGWAIGAVVVAVVSMVAAIAIGLLLRRIPALRYRWLANGELTVAGTVLGALGVLGHHRV